MPTSFDLKKYLAQVAFMNADELRDTVVNGRTVGAGLEEYLKETHMAGANIVGNYVTEEELKHLVALIAGISCSKVLDSTEVDPEEKVFLAKAMMNHANLLSLLSLSVLCAAAGVINKEEWR